MIKDFKEFLVKQNALALAVGVIIGAAVGITSLVAGPLAGGVVMTMFDMRTKLSRQVVDEVKQHLPDKIFETVIPRSVLRCRRARLRPATR